MLEIAEVIEEVKSGEAEATYQPPQIIEMVTLTSAALPIFKQYGFQ